MKKRLAEAAATVLSAVATGLVVSYLLPSAFEFVSLIPFMFVLLSRAGGEKWLRRGLRLGFLYFYVYYLTVWHWFLQMYPLEFTGISRPAALAVVVVAWLGLPLFQTSAAMWQAPLFLFMARSPLLSRDGRPRASAPAAFAAVLVMFEWIQSLTWAGVPWGRLAIGQAYVPPMIGTASLFGSYFVSFVVAAVNAYIAYAIILFLAGDRIRAAASCTAALVILTANLTYGSLRIYIKDKNAPAPEINASESENGDILTVSVVQGNVSSKDKWRDGSYGNLFSTYASLTAASADEGADMVVFPETAMPWVVNGDRTVLRDDLEELSRLSGSVLIATAFWKGDGESSYNAVITVDPELGLDEEHTYYKRHLVPFGEFVPFEDVIRVLVPPLADIGLFDGDISTGDAGRVLETRFGTVGAMVCFDSIYEGSGLDAVRAGAELLSVSTNDSWFDGSAAIRQHTAQSVLRAVECDRYVCRAGNTGFSCIISPAGEIVSSVEAETRGIAVCNVEMRSTRTLYSRIGNGFIGAVAVFAAVCVISSVIVNCKTKSAKRKADAEDDVCDRNRHRDIGDEDGAV